MRCQLIEIRIKVRNHNADKTHHKRFDGAQNATLHTPHLCVCLPAALLLLLHEHLEQDIRVNPTHASSATSVVMVVAVVVPVSCVRVVQVLQLHALVVSTPQSTRNSVTEHYACNRCASYCPELQTTMVINFIGNAYFCFFSEQESTS